MYPVTTGRSALVRHLIQAFSAQEFSLLIATCFDSAVEIRGAIQQGLPDAIYVEEAFQALERRGAVQRSFLNEIVRLRPSLAGTVDGYHLTCETELGSRIVIDSDGDTVKIRSDHLNFDLDVTVALDRPVGDVCEETVRARSLQRRWCPHGTSGVRIDYGLVFGGRRMEPVHSLSQERVGPGDTLTLEMRCTSWAKGRYPVTDVFLGAENQDAGVSVQFMPRPVQRWFEAESALVAMRFGLTQSTQR